MKKLIVLPGNSVQNQAWGEGVVLCFGNWFDKVYMQYYDHWQAGTTELDIEAELTKLKDAGAGGEETYIIAKSIGSILALMAIKRGYLKPERCVFFGIPIDLAAKELFKDDWSALDNFAVPTLAFHNDNDPTASYAFTKDTLESRAPHIQLVTRSGDDHNYTEFSEFEAPLKGFFGL